MDHLDNLKKHLKEEIDSLKQKIAHNQEIKNSAPASTESRSDTTRHRYEEMIENQKKELKMLENNLSLVPSFSNKTNQIKVWDYLEVNLNDRSNKFLLVPTGLGGKKVGDIQLLAIDSPLGKALLGKKVKEVFDFNGRSANITQIA